MATAPIGLRLDQREQGAIAHLTVENMSKLNTLNSANMIAFVEQVEALGHRDDLRAVVLTGAGDKAFIGGADIRSPRLLRLHDRPAAARQRRPQHRGEYHQAYAG